MHFNKIFNSITLYQKNYNLFPYSKLKLYTGFLRIDHILLNNARQNVRNNTKIST